MAHAPAFELKRRLNHYAPALVDEAHFAILDDGKQRDGRSAVSSFTAGSSPSLACAAPGRGTAVTKASNKARPMAHEACTARPLAMGRVGNTSLSWRFGVRE